MRATEAPEFIRGERHIDNHVVLPSKAVGKPMPSSCAGSAQNPAS